MTPGTGAEAVPGLTDFEARSGGEGEVGASVIGTYWFAQSVDEMTAHPRPASPEPTTVVETDHPLWSCHPEARAYALLTEPQQPSRTASQHTSVPLVTTGRTCSRRPAPVGAVPGAAGPGPSAVALRQYGAHGSDDEGADHGGT